MKKLLITLLLISPFSFADWGDVYYCQMTGHITLDNEGAIKNWNLEKFQFKLDKAKESFVFGDSSSDYLPKYIFVDDLSKLDLSYFIGFSGFSGGLKKQKACFSIPTPIRITSIP